MLSSLGTSYLSAFRLDDATNAYKMALELANEQTERVKTAIALAKSMRWNVDYSPSLAMYDDIAVAGAKDEGVRATLGEGENGHELGLKSNFANLSSDSPCSSQLLNNSSNLPLTL